MSTLILPHVQGLLRRLHQEAESQLPELWTQIQQMKKEQLQGLLWVERLQKFYLSITPEQGFFLYQLVRQRQAKTIVEFGTSVGVSTIYIAAALKDSGAGIVIGTEMLPSKVALTNRHLAEAQLTQWADIRVGDALETLKDVAVPVDLVFMDGEPDYYLNVVKLLMPKLGPNALVLADNIGNRPGEYADFIQNPANGFRATWIKIPSGIEMSIAEWGGYFSD